MLIRVLGRVDFNDQFAPVQLRRSSDRYNDKK